MAPGVLTTLKTEVEFSAGTWTDITAYVRAEAGASGTFGRPNEFEDCAPSTWKFSVRNDDGRFMPDNPLSPYWPNVVENRRVRVTATKGATSWRRFLGYITAWQPGFPKSDGNTGTVDVTAADLLGVLARRGTATGFVEQANYVARYFASWVDLFPFPADVAGASSASVFRNVGTTVAGQSLAQAVMVNAKTGAGTFVVERADSELILEGQLTFKPSGNVGPVLKIKAQASAGQVDFFLNVPTDTSIAVAGTPLTVLDLWTETTNLGSLRLYNDGVRTHLGWYNGSGTWVSGVSTAIGWNIAQMNDGLWHKITIFDLGARGLGTGVGVNIDDLLSGSYVSITTTAILPTTRLIWGGSYGGPSKEGKQVNCPACSVAGINIQGTTFGVNGYYALGQPASTSYISRFGQLLGYADTLTDRRKMDGVISFTSGSAAMISSTPVFSSDDVGQGMNIGVYAPIDVTIAAYVSPTEVTLSRPAEATGSGLTVVLQGPTVGTDNRTVVRVNTLDTGDLASALQNLARTVGGVFWVNAQGRPEMLLADALRLKTPIATIDVEADGDGDSIELSRSIDSAPTRVTVQSPVGTVVLVDDEAEAAGSRREITVSTGAASTTDGTAIAGYYLNVSKSLRVTSISVDLATAGSDLYAALLGGLKPGSRLRLTGLPSTVFGYSQTDVYVQGWREDYSREAVRLTFDCTPADDPVEALVEDAEYGRFAGDGTLLLAFPLTVGATSIGVAPGATGTPVLTGSASDYPVDLEVFGERVTATGAGSTPSRTNRCTNPSFETNTTGWSGVLAGKTTSTLATSTAQAKLGISSLRVTWPTAIAGGSVVHYTAAGLTIGLVYTFSIYAFVPAGSPAVQVVEGTGAGTSVTYSPQQATTGTTGAWVRIGITLTASAATHVFAVTTVTASTSGQVVYLDGALLEQVTAGVGSYFDGAVNGGGWTGTAHASTSTQTYRSVPVTRGVVPSVARAHNGGEEVNVWHEAAFAF